MLSQFVPARSSGNEAMAMATGIAAHSGNIDHAARRPAGHRIKASPLARRLALQRRIELASIAGTGPDGRIVRADVVAAASHTPFPDAPHDVPELPALQRASGQRLAEYGQQAPHLHLTVDICLNPLLELRARLNGELEKRGLKLTINDMLIKALAMALIEVPACNLTVSGDRTASFKRADISFDVAVAGRSVTPVVTSANTKSVAAIASETRDLIARARVEALKPEECSGGTATLSNLGMYGIQHYGATTNPSQAMTMAIGAAGKRPIVIDDVLTSAMVMSATGSFNRCVVQGAEAAILMSVFQRLLEKPLQIIV